VNFLTCELVNIPKYQLRYNTQKAMHKQAPKCILLWKGNLNGDGQQFYQYQQIERYLKFLLSTLLQQQQQYIQ
jgi:hypothetical protein